MVASLIDRPPPWWLAMMFRASAVLFHWHLGWLFGGRLLMLTHVGRRTGRKRFAVLEVVSTEADPSTWYVAAAWGSRADWYRNLARNPRAEIAVGRRRCRVTARTVGIDEAIRVYSRYVRDHPWGARLVGRVIGVDLVRTDPVVLADRIPLVALRADPAEDRGQSDIAPVFSTRAETQATYDRLARFYEILEGFWERRARAAGLRALSVEQGEFVFEIGSGPGNSLVELTRSVGPQGRSVGVDLSFNMCSVAQRRLIRRSAAGIGSVVQGDAVDLPLRTGSCDAAFMSFTLELFDTPLIPRVLAECRRVLRPGGRLVVVALSKEEPAPLMQRIYEWGHMSFPRFLDCRPIYVDRALVEAGFTLMDHRVLALWGLPIAVTVGRDDGSTVKANPR